MKSLINYGTIIKLLSEDIKKEKLIKTLEQVGKSKKISENEISKFRSKQFYKRRTKLAAFKDLLEKIASANDEDELDTIINSYNNVPYISKEDSIPKTISMFV